MQLPTLPQKFVAQEHVKDPIVFSQPSFVPHGLLLHSLTSEILWREKAVSMLSLSWKHCYTGDAGRAIMTRISVKFGTRHDRSRPEVGSTKLTSIRAEGFPGPPSSQGILSKK